MLNDLIVGPEYDALDHSLYSQNKYNPLREEYIGGDMHNVAGETYPAPFRVFRNIEDLFAAPAQGGVKNNTFKGLLIWDLQRYYNNNPMFPVRSSVSTGTWEDTSLQSVESPSNSVGCFIVPSFGQVSIIPNREYKQNITITFDSNASIDADPYGMLTMEYIDWFINANHQIVSVINQSFVLPESGTETYVLLQSISDPIYSAGTSYVRRAVTLTLRYCSC